MHTINPNFYRNKEEICWGTCGVYLSQAPLRFRALDHIWFVGALAWAQLLASMLVPRYPSLAPGPWGHKCATYMSVSHRICAFRDVVRRRGPRGVLILGSLSLYRACSDVLE